MRHNPRSVQAHLAAKSLTILLAAACAGAIYGAPPSIGSVLVNPLSLVAGTPTPVLFTAAINEPGLIPSSVRVIQRDAQGNLAAVLGAMNDAGTGGDATAGDRVYTLQATLNFSTPGTVVFVVSAAFSGLPVRSPSTGVNGTVTGFSAPVSLSILSPGNLSFLNITPTTVTGTVSGPASSVTVNELTAPVTNGRFTVVLPLREGPNTITAAAGVGGGSISTASIQTNLDTTPPHVAITSPPNNFVTTDASITVSGLVNDIVVGTVNDQQATVTINGTNAQVANRTFLATGVPLSIGANNIQAIARDRVGNSVTIQTTVTRQAPAPSQIRSVSGNNQTSAISTQVSAPLIAQLIGADGNPAANVPVVFRVVQNNGLLSTAAPGGIASMAVNTNAQGQAQVRWTLGARSGSGGNTVEATSAGFAGTAIFSATGTQGAASRIVVDNGNDQTGAVGLALAKPLIAVVIDAGNNRLGNVPVTFNVVSGGGTINGLNSFAVNTDPDGRAAATLTLGPQAGIANHAVEANFVGNAGLSALFTATAKIPGSPANTTISGLVLDNSSQPIRGVTVRAVLSNVLTSNSGIIATLPSVTTNAQGQFTFLNAPVGFVKLLVDGTTAVSSFNYPTLDYDLVTIAGQDNGVGMPIYLPALSNNRLCVTQTTGGGTLTMPEAPGFRLTFGPGQVTFPGGSRDGCVSVTLVHPDKMPMVPGFGQQPRFLITIQPAGAVFNPPAPISMPNVDGLPPNSVTEMYSFDHDIGEFVAIGTGIVSVDGLAIVSSPGVGVLKAGWHCGGDPAANGTVADCPDCKICLGNRCQTVSNGSNPRDSNTCCFNGDPLNKFGQTVGNVFAGPLEDMCPRRTQNNSVGHVIDGCSNPVTPDIKDDPMQLFSGIYPSGMFNQAPTLFGQDLSGSPGAPAGPLPCNQHDICYQTCAAPGVSMYDHRLSCDAGMGNRMDTVCAAAYPSSCPSTLTTIQCISYHLQRADCYTYSAAYYAVLRGFGFFAAFKGRQEQYCQCCP